MLLLKIRERFQCIKIRERSQCSPFDTHAMQIHLKAMSFRCLSTRISKFETRNPQYLSKCSQSISKLMIKIVQVKSIRTWANELFGLRLHVFIGDIILQQVLHQYVTYPKSMTIITKISILKHLLFFFDIEIHTLQI